MKRRSRSPASPARCAPTRTRRRGTAAVRRPPTGRRRKIRLGGLFGRDVFLRPDVLRCRLGDEGRLAAAFDRLLGDDALGDIASGGQLELDVLEGLLEDRPQATGAGLALEGLVG